MKPDTTMRYTNKTASHKIAVGTAIGAPASVVIVWCLQTFADITVPAEVGMAFGTLVTGILSIFVPTSEE